MKLSLVLTICYEIDLLTITVLKCLLLIHHSVLCNIVSKTYHLNCDTLIPVLGPINATSKLRMNSKPESDGSNFSIPKVLVNLELQKLQISKYFDVSFSFTT